MFHERCASPTAFYERLRQRNPAPFEFLFNLGEGRRDGEYLVGASPEMYVRVTGDRVETCPISGTIARGSRPAGGRGEHPPGCSASAKEESELTMCTDVDRNDKSRVCVPGSVRVIGRRQIEMYSRLIHTVDHIEGRLRPGFDALDAFLTHMWAVTVTGAPKAWAMQFIEDHEDTTRRWYGGAVGMIGFDGSMNTGLTLRTAQIHGGVAAVRAGATLLFDSDPEAEERETQLKARALLETLREGEAPARPPPAGGADAAPGRRIGGLPDGPAARRAPLRCCWSTTRTRSCTRWPTTSASTAPRSPRCGPASRPRCSTRSPRTWSCCRPAPAGRRTSAATSCCRSSTRAACPRSASASACRRWSSTRAATLSLLPDAAARQAAAGSVSAPTGAACCSTACPRSSPPPAITPSTPPRPT